MAQIPWLILHKQLALTKFGRRLVIMHLSIETPTPPTPGLCGAMWGIVMVFDGMVSPWGWGISQDLLSIFMAVHGSRGARWGFDSCLVSSR